MLTSVGWSRAGTPLRGVCHGECGADGIVWRLPLHAGVFSRTARRAVPANAYVCGLVTGRGRLSDASATVSVERMESFGDCHCTRGVFSRTARRAVPANAYVCGFGHGQGCLSEASGRESVERVESFGDCLCTRGVLSRRVRRAVPGNACVCALVTGRDASPRRLPRRVWSGWNRLEIAFARGAFSAGQLGELSLPMLTCVRWSRAGTPLRGVCHGECGADGTVWRLPLHAGVFSRRVRRAVPANGADYLIMRFQGSYVPRRWRKRYST